jgi:hypothetical protein
MFIASREPLADASCCYTIILVSILVNISHAPYTTNSTSAGLYRMILATRIERDTQSKHMPRRSLLLVGVGQGEVEEEERERIYFILARATNAIHSVHRPPYEASKTYMTFNSTYYMYEEKKTKKKKKKKKFCRLSPDYT